MKRLLSALALTAAAAFSVHAAESPRWTSIVVTFSIEKDGTVHMTEHATVEVPAGVDSVSRELWSDAEQVLSVDRLSRIDPATGTATPIAFEIPYAGKVRWKAGPGTQTYELVTTYADGLVPAWTITRGNLTRADTAPLDPKLHLAALLRLWREALQNPMHRYLMDVQYNLPRDAQQTTELRFNLEYDNAFRPVHPITPDAITRRIEQDFYDPERWRATHLFDYTGPGTPAAVDLRHHALRLAAIFGFPVAALLLWLLFLWGELPPSGKGGELDEEALRKTLFNEPPEVVAARWSGSPSVPRIEPFLRRLEAQHKIALTIESEEDVTVRLLVPRGQLTPYERAGIEALIPEGTSQVTSDDIQKRGEFDPSETLYQYLLDIVAESGNDSWVPWYVKGTSIILFAAGVWLAGLEIVRHHREPVVVAAGLILGSAITGGFPNRFVRRLIARSRWWSLTLLLPVAVATFAIGIIHLAGDIPPTYLASAGFSLMMLATCKAAFDSTASRSSREVRDRRAELASARRWLRTELRNPNPRLTSDFTPYLVALGLQPPPQLMLKEEEDWGDGLVA